MTPSDTRPPTFVGGRFGGTLIASAIAIGLNAAVAGTDSAGMPVTLGIGAAAVGLLAYWHMRAALGVVLGSGVLWVAILAVGWTGEQGLAIFFLLVGVGAGGGAILVAGYVRALRWTGRQDGRGPA